MVALRTTSQFTSESLRQPTPAPEPRKEFAIDPIVVNPKTCALIDISDHTKPNIDRMAECLADIKKIVDDLHETKRRIERSLEGELNTKKSAPRTQCIAGLRHEIVCELPSRKFNNKQLKLLWERFSQEPELRSTFLRIQEVSVNLKDFKIAEGIANLDGPKLELVEAIQRAEEATFGIRFVPPEIQESSGESSSEPNESAGSSADAADSSLSMQKGVLQDGSDSGVNW